MAHTDLITVTINNWDKHNPRKDIKRPTWFSVDNRMIEDPDFFAFNHGEFKSWIYILSRASQKHCGTIDVHFDHAERVCGIKKSDMNAAIEKLLGLHIVTVSVRDPYVSVRNPYAHVTHTNPTDRQTDRQTPPPRDPRTEVILEFQIDPSISEFITKFKITQEVQKGWLDLYGIDCVRREIIKAIGWLSANAGKSPKSVSGATRFMSKWLEKGWENYRKTIPSEKDHNSNKNKIHVIGSV